MALLHLQCPTMEVLYKCLEGMNESIPSENSPVNDPVTLHHPQLLLRPVSSSSLTSIRIKLPGLLVFFKMSIHFIISLGVPQALHIRHILISSPQRLPTTSKRLLFPLELEIQTRGKWWEGEAVELGGLFKKTNKKPK